MLFFLAVIIIVVAYACKKRLIRLGKGVRVWIDRFTGSSDTGDMQCCIEIYGMEQRNK